MLTFVVVDSKNGGGGLVGVMDLGTATESWFCPWSDMVPG